MLFHDLHNDKLEFHVDVINALIGDAVEKKTLRLVRPGEHYIIVVQPGMHDSKPKLKLTAFISSDSQIYNISNQALSAVTRNKVGQTHISEWWNDYHRASIHGVKFTKKRIKIGDNELVSLLFHAVDGLSGKKAARAYRIKYGSGESTVFDMMKFDHSYWVDDTAVAHLGHVDDVEVTPKAAQPQYADGKRTTRNGKAVLVPVVTAPKKKQRTVNSLSALGSLLAESKKRA